MAGALENANAYPTAQEILAEALGTIHPSDVDSLLKIARLQVKADDRTAATALLSRAVEVAEATIGPDETLSEGVSYLMHERLRRVVYLLDAASLQGELGNKAASARTIRKALQAARAPSAKKRSYEVSAHVSALRDIALAQLSNGEQDAATATIQQAMEIAGTLQDAPEQRVRLLTGIAIRQAELGNADIYKATLAQAAHIAETSAGPDRITAWADIAAAEAQQGDLESAKTTLESALHISGSEKESQSLLPYKIYAQAMVAEGFKDGGDPDAAAMIIRKALEVVESIRDPSVKSIALRNIALAQARLGDIDGAFRSETGIVEESYKGLSFPYIAEAQIKKGDFSAALRTADALGEFDPLRKEAVVASVAKAYAKTGHVQDALALSTTIGHPFRALTFRTIGEAIAEAGDVDQALAWASRQRHALEKAYALIGIAEGLLGRSNEVRHE